MTAAVAAFMAVSFNGVPADVVQAQVASGDLDLIEAQFGTHSAFAIVRRNGAAACIESVQGRGGALLARRIADVAREHGVLCNLWPMSESRARLARRVGFRATGKEHVSDNGVRHIEVSA